MPASKQASKQAREKQHVGARERRTGWNNGASVGQYQVANVSWTHSWRVIVSPVGKTRSR